jgi:hypothetical protein
VDEKKKDTYLYIVSLLLGALIFIWIYGVNVLNPTYDAWLYRLVDLSQHYVGWKFYRVGGWSFPIGLIDNLAYPTKTSVIFTDSIPLFAVIFKILSPLLPETFQYFGLWGLMSFVLQGFLAVKILRRLSVGRYQSLAASVFFVISPMVIEKMFRHTALGGHWIILAAIYLFVCHRDEYVNYIKTSLQWGLVGFLVAGVHLYYLPMCGIFMGGYVLCSIVREKRFSLRAVLPCVAFMLGLLGNTWLLGGFASGISGDSDGLGYFSFNLNGFFNSKGYSRVFKSLPTYYDGQYEGFAYLGLGIYALLIVTMFFAVLSIVKLKGKKIRDKSFVLYGAVYILMSLGLIMFAASPEVTFNDKLLFTYPYSSTLYHYWSIFRSTGRIVWPVCYLIYVGVVVCSDRLWRDRVNIKFAANVIITICVFLQVFDLSGKLTGKRSYFDDVEYETFMQSDIWDKLSEKESVKHVVWASNNFDNKDIIYIADYAYSNNWTMNNYYFARGVNIRENTEKSLNNLSDDCIYLFNADEPLVYDLNYYEADGYIVGTTFKIE